MPTQKLCVALQQLYSCGTSVLLARTWRPLLLYSQSNFPQQQRKGGGEGGGAAEQVSLVSLPAAMLPIANVDQAVQIVLHRDGVSVLPAVLWRICPTGRQIAISSHQVGASGNSVEEPNGRIWPIRDDRSSLLRLQAVLSFMNVDLADHIILAMEALCSLCAASQTCSSHLSRTALFHISEQEGPGSWGHRMVRSSRQGARGTHL